MCTVETTSFVKRFVGCLEEVRGVRGVPVLSHKLFRNKTYDKCVVLFILVRVARSRQVLKNNISHMQEEKVVLCF